MAFEDRQTKNGDRTAPDRRDKEADHDRNILIERNARERAANEGPDRAFGANQIVDTRPVYGPVPRPSSSYPNYQEGGPLQYGRWSPRHSNAIPEADRPIASREGPPVAPEDLEGPIHGPFLPHDPRSLSHYIHSQIQGRARPFTDRPYMHQESSGNNAADRDSSKGRLLDPNLRKSLEDAQMSHRSILGASYDSHRRTERSSPLPQAVQGASSQPVGSGRDPTIKHEFGRMFSGLGSGVGSTPVPMAPASNGSPTPNRGGNGKILALKFHWNSTDTYSDRQSRSPGAERLKRSYEMDQRADSDMVEGRLTPGLPAGRANKRNKHAHAAPHHHHHPLGQQYVLHLFTFIQ